MGTVVISIRSAARNLSGRALLLLTLPPSLLAVAPVLAAAQEVPRVIGPSEAGLPFKAVFTTTSTISADPARCAELVSNVTGEGLANQLGKFTTTQTACLTPSTDPFIFRRGLYVFTAADGATLRGHYGGRIVPTQTSGEDGQYLIDAAWSITGGTGRFSGATGGGSASGLLTPTTGDANVVLDGHIRVLRGPVPVASPGP